MKIKLYRFLGLITVMSMVFTACATAPTSQAVTNVPESGGVNNPPISAEPTTETPTEIALDYKVLQTFSGVGDIPTIDPALSEDTNSIQIVDNTTIGLTHLHEETSVLEAGISSTWDVVNNEDGTQTITFHLREDVPWVRWNGVAVETVKTCDGSADRMVKAEDFAYGIYRNLLPENASPYAYLLGFVLKGATDFNSGINEDFGTVGVKVVNDTTLEMTFLTQAVYNVEIAGLWVARAAPKWLIEGEVDAEGNQCVEARGDRWTEPGFFQSYGPYTLSEWVHDSSMVLMKNPFWPGMENIPQPKIDEIRFAMIDAPAAMSEYEAGNMDFLGGVPLADLDRVMSDPVYSQEFKITANGCTSPVIQFNTKAPVVDDVRVRRALSFAIDRQSLIDNVLKDGRLPAKWFTAPGMAGGPTLETNPELGVSYDPDMARSELQSYLDEKGLTADQLDLTFTFNTSAAQQQVAEVYQQMWKDTLGVNVKLVNLEWRVFLEITKSKDTPQMYRGGWCLDYPDANNFVREVYAVNGSNNPAENGEPYGGVNWKNDEFESLVAQAAVEIDPIKRAELYSQAEKILVLDDAVIAPITWSVSTSLTRPYIVRTFGLGSKEAFYKWDILSH